MRRPYRQPGLELRPRSGPPDPFAKALQVDLRSLGYLRAGIDGRFGAGTASAVRALQHDLLTAGRHGSDGDAPVALQTFNRGRVTGLTGVVDERLAACIEDILGDRRITTLPRSAEPARANQDALAQIQQLVGLPVPRPFLLAIFLQESGGLHYRVPAGRSALHDRLRAVCGRGPRRHRGRGSGLSGGHRHAASDPVPSGDGVPPRA